jgi:hypothetical protein
MIDAEALIEVAVVEYVNRLEEELAELKSAAREHLSAEGTMEHYRTATAMAALVKEVEDEER